MAKSSAVTPDQFNTFGELLKFLRHRAGLTQIELSIAVGYSESQISRLEQNQRAPDVAALAARFVPALQLDNEREWAARLLELAAASRAEDQPEQREKQTEKSLHNLPLQLTSFIGREREIAELKQLLSTLRLVTLTGVGGVGKTRLAIQVASELVKACPDGAWLVDLAPLADPMLVPQRVAAVFGLREEPSRPLTDTLMNYLRAKNLLLVLDNCEHLIEACARLTEALLGNCPDLQILATSREALGISGERNFNVPPLDAPDPQQISKDDKHFLKELSQYDAVQLFVERAGAGSPHFNLTIDNARAVAQVCQRLDGIPLAIELAAARLKMMSVEQIAARLDDRFRLLTGGSRTALPRHQTLQAMIDWSYELLTEAEQVLLRRLSVFAGGWTLEAVEAVCVVDDPRSSAEGGGDVVAAESGFDLLSKLIDKSLALVEVQSGAARYRMLETIRQYALEKLKASGEEDTVRRRHAAYYLILAETGAHLLSGEAGPSWLNRIELEYNNLRAAMRWSQSTADGAELGLRIAGALRWFWFARGYWSDACGWLEDALAHPEAVGYAHGQAVALLNLGDVLAMQGDYAAGQAKLTDSLRLFQELGEMSWSVWALHRLGWLAREHNDTGTARLRLEESLALSRELEDRVSIAWVLTTLGEVAVMQEDTALATTLLEEGLALFREQEATFGIGWSLNHLGHVAQLRGEYERATRLYQDSLPLFQEFGTRNLGVAWGHQGLGETALAQGDPALAAKHLKEALTLFRYVGDRAGMAWCLTGLAGVAALEEEPERAAWLWGAGEALRQSIGARHAPASRATRERLMAEVREQLGEAGFAAAWEEGQAMSLEEAIALALDTESVQETRHRTAT